jgi:hypothetical protein
MIYKRNPTIIKIRATKNRLSVKAVDQVLKSDILCYIRVIWVINYETAKTITVLGRYATKSILSLS